MRLVISDTGPVNYLVLIGHVEVLAVLFEKVLMPCAVLEELLDPDAPPEVRMFFRQPPVWIEIAGAPHDWPDTDRLLSRLDDGEKAAIALAAAVKADLLLMDDREGAVAARRIGLAVTGTLGVLDIAAARGLLDLEQAFDRLRRTFFRCPEHIMEALLSSHGKARVESTGPCSNASTADDQ